jgi:hypothetical protein
MASIAPDDALILPHRANPRWIGFSGTTGLADDLRQNEEQQRDHRGRRYVIPSSDQTDEVFGIHR